jgi:hypothetical protein
LVRILLDAEQGVGQRRLAGAARSDQHHGCARRQPAIQLGDLAAVLGIDRIHRAMGTGKLLDLRTLGLEVRAAVGLGQHQHRRRPGLADDRQIALEAARIEVAVEAADDQHGIDVGGDDLLAPGLAGGDAAQLAVARQQGLDLPLVIDRRAHPHPVADRRPQGVVAIAPSRRGLGARPQHRGAVVHFKGIAMMHDHARQLRGRERRRWQHGFPPADAAQGRQELGIGHGRIVGSDADARTSPLGE